MNNFISILIIEDDNNACNELCQCIAQYEDLKVVAVCNSAKDALKKAHYHLPNVIILDLELHHGEGNGLFFLDSLLANPLPLNPFILVTTNNMSTVILEQAKVLGADFTLAKYEQGYSAQYVIDNIRMLKNAVFHKNAIRHVTTTSPAAVEQLILSRIQREMDLIGVKASCKGYKYLVESIYLIIQNSEVHISRTLAEKHKKSSTSIERAMQNAIKQCWTTSAIDDLYNFYPGRVRPEKGYPTLMEFIYTYAGKIKLEINTDTMPSNSI